MSENNVSDRIDEIIELQRGGLSNKEIGLILATRQGRQEQYHESTVRHAYAKALSKRAKELGLGE